MPGWQVCASLGAGLDCIAPATRAVAWVVALIGGGVSGGSPFTTRPAVSALGGSGPHCAPLGLETWLEKLQGSSLEEEASLSFCSAYCSCVFPRLASSPVGLAWDLPQLCRSCPSKCRGTRAICFDAKGRKRRSQGWLSSDGLLPVCLSAH